MPYPALDNVTQLKPIFVDTFDDFSKQLEEYLTKEHKSDGTHGAITADSAAIAGNLTVSGTTILQNITGTAITADSLDVNSITAHVSINIALPGSGILEVGGHNFVASGTDGSLAMRGDLSIGAPVKFSAAAATGNTAIGGTLGVTGATTLGTLLATGNVALTGGGLSINVDGTQAPGQYFQVVSDTSRTLLRGIRSDGSQARTLTTDGLNLWTFSPNIAIAGTLDAAGTTTITKANAAGALQLIAATSTNAAYAIFSNNFGQLGFVGRDNSAGTAIGTGGHAFALSMWQQSNHALQFGVNNAEVGFWDATQLKITGGLRASGAIQFDSLTSGYLNTDGSGNVSATAGVPLVQNGINFGPFPVSSITVVNGQVTNIS